MSLDTNGYQGLLAFRLSNQMGYSGLWVVKVDDSGGPVHVPVGATPVEVAPPPSEEGWLMLAPAFSPVSGTQCSIAYVRQGPDGNEHLERTVWVVDVDYGETLGFSNHRQIYYYDGVGSVGCVVGSPTWSSHAAPQVIFTANSGEAHDQTGAFDLYWASPAGTAGGWLTQLGDKVYVSNADWNPAWVGTP